MNRQFSTLAFLWPLLALVCLLIIFTGLKRVLQKTGWEQGRQQKIFYTTVFVVALWAGLLMVLSLNGFFAHFDKLPPRPALAILTPLPFVLIAAFSKTGTALLKQVPPQRLIFVQTFRVFVELLILFAFLAGRLPVQMSLEGRNFDIVAGLLAFPVGYFCFVKKSWPRGVAILFNILGIVLLLNVLVVAFLSMPGPLRYFMNEPATTLVTGFPYIVLPGILVPIAYSMHIFSLRQLLARQ
jgi:hypothetical protein